MSATRDLLIEIGTEELPPKALQRMSEALQASLDSLLSENHLAHGTSQAYAAPRRLAVLIRDVPETQPDRKVTKRGPALQVAFDDDGKPTKPAEGFARSCGVAVSDLQQLETDKGSWLMFKSSVAGQPATEIIPALLEKALKTLPMPKRMRWGSSDIEFVRPVHWVLLLFGNEPVKTRILGIDSDRYTRGHRFHHPDRIEITTPASYAETLQQTGMVIADMALRRASIQDQVSKAGIALGGHAHMEPALLDEVCALVEWPVAISGSFDERFLEVPAARTDPCRQRACYPPTSARRSVFLEPGSQAVTGKPCRATRGHDLSEATRLTR